MTRLSLQVFYLLRHVSSTAPPFMLWWWNLEILLGPLHRSSPLIGELRCQAIQNGTRSYIAEKTQNAVYIVRCLWPTLACQWRMRNFSTRGLDVQTMLEHRPCIYGRRHVGSRCKISMGLKRLFNKRFLGWKRRTRAQHWVGDSGTRLLWAVPMGCSSFTAPPRGNQSLSNLFFILLPESLGAGTLALLILQLEINCK
jgi:hypothetical protein